MLTSTQQQTWHNRHPVTLLQSKVVHYQNFEMPPHLSNLTHNRHRHERKLYKCRNNSIVSITIFHATSVGLLYSLICTLFSFFIILQRGTVTFVFIIWSVFQLMDLETLLMSILDEMLLFLIYDILTTRLCLCKQSKDINWFINSGREELYWNYFVSYKKIKGSSFL